MTFPALLQNRMDRLHQKNQFRALAIRRGTDFSSNDYLNFAEDPALLSRVKQRVNTELLTLGSTGSRLLRGNTESFEKLEENLAEFSSREAALLFPSGFQANIGLLSALLGPEDLVFSDALNHASLIDGMKLSGAKKFIYPHGDTATLNRLLEDNKSLSGLRLIVTESLFSMDGDLAPLKELVRLAKEHQTHLLVDEAHSTGLYGAGDLGGGLVQKYGLQNEVLATVHTGGKALGVSGAWIACDKSLKDYLINHCRSFIFSTAPAPLIALALQESLKFWIEVGTTRTSKLWENCARFKSRLELRVSGPIFPVIIGSNERAVEVANTLKGEGFDVRAIRPPTVPEGTARLRITIRSKTTEAAIDQLASTILRTRKYKT